MNDEAFVDEEMEPDFRLDQLTDSIAGAAIEVHHRPAAWNQYHLLLSFVKNGISRIAH